jgi:hypothetical protein
MQNMKNIEHKFLLFLFASVIGSGFFSCTREGEIVVIPKTLSEYIAEQTPFINAELPVVRNCTVGYDKGNYSVSLNSVTATSLALVKTAYLTVLKADSALIISPTVKIPQIVAANQALGTPGKAFWTGINLCDKRPLNDAVTAANTLNASVVVGTSPGNVPAEAKTAYTAAIKTATTTRDATTTTIDRQVTEAIDKLRASTATFNSAIIK